MLKHVGRHGDRKVAIIFREIPGEEHMCLVIYPDVLPTHFHDMEMGDEAVKRMRELDANAGIVPPEVKRRAEAEFKSKQANQPPMAAPTNAALDDKTLAANMLAQAKKMEIEAKGLVAEAARMKKDAERMFPSVTPKETVAENPKPTRKKAAQTDAIQ
jgi:hypothetical protein